MYTFLLAQTYIWNFMGWIETYKLLWSFWLIFNFVCVNAYVRLRFWFLGNNFRIWTLLHGVLKLHPCICALEDVHEWMNSLELKVLWPIYFFLYNSLCFFGIPYSTDVNFWLIAYIYMSLFKTFCHFITDIQSIKMVKFFNLAISISAFAPKM